MEDNEKRKILLKLEEVEDELTDLKYITQKNKLKAGANITINNGTISATVPNIDTSSLQPKLTAGENITIENNVISASGGQSCNCAETIQDLQNQFELLKKTHDPYYNPKSFSDYPQGQILQGYARAWRYGNQNYSGTTVKTGDMIYTAEANSEGILKLKIIFYLNSQTPATLNVYQNGEIIYTEAIQTLEGEQTFERTIQGVTLQASNIFSYKILLNYNRMNRINYYETELIGPNVEVVNQKSPFVVEYFNGKYYLSDCSGSTAKIAEINVNDIQGMEDIVWTDTGIHCLDYKFGFNKLNQSGVYVPDKTIHLYSLNDCNYTMHKLGESYYANISQYCCYDTIPAVSESVFYTTIKTDNQTIYLNEYRTSPYNSVNMTTIEGCNIAGCKYNYTIPDTVSRKFVVITQKNGNNILARLVKNNVSTFNLGFGTNCHIYFTNTTNNSCTMSCFMKYYDKIIRRDISWSQNDGFLLLNTIEIGEYEEYFEGANNDYFVVKHGKLKYYKKPN